MDDWYQDTTFSNFVIEQVTTGDVSNIISSMLLNVQKTIQDAIKVRNTVVWMQQSSAESALSVLSAGTFFHITLLLSNGKMGPSTTLLPISYSQYIAVLWDIAVLRDIAVLSMAGICEAPCSKLNPALIKSGSKTNISTQKTSLARARKVMEAVEY